MMSWGETLGVAILLDELLGVKSEVGKTGNGLEPTTITLGG